MMNQVTIKPLTVADIDMLRQMSIDTFVDTYASFNTPENMALHIVAKFDKEVLLNEMNYKHNYFFAAMLNSVPAGYIKLRTAEEPEALRNRKHIELERIYVVKEFQGTGLGYKLIQYCIDFASVKGYEVLWLGVWKQNERAFNFYTKCGFEIFGEHSFILGSDEQVDWLMKKELLI